MNNVYIGFDSSNYGQKLAYEVCKRSIEKYNKDIKVNCLIKKELEEKGLFDRDDNTGATEFTYTRFLVPYLNNYQGWALFCDSDFLWFCDVNEIFEKYADEKYAVCCVKHEYTDCHGKEKMDGQKQEWYPRKNWSSLMLINCGHPSVENLTLDNINSQSPAWLHRMQWCKDEEIGTIPKSYNYLVDYYTDGDYKALHYTDGGPWHPGYEDVTYGNLWLDYLNVNEKFRITHKRKHDVLYITTFNKYLYEKYAYRFIDTFEKVEGDLIIYSEENLSYLQEKIPQAKIVNSFQLVPEMVDFIKRNSKRNMADKKRGFFFDGIRFCYKVFAVTHAGMNLPEYKYMVWVDADCFFKNELTFNDLNKFIKPNTLMSYLGRNKQYSECGFLIFNLDHEYCYDYLRSMKKMYTKNTIYTLPEWHDSYVWDYVRKKFEKRHGIKNYSISGHDKDGHVLLKTKLYHYIDHLKGPLKAAGSSDKKVKKNKKK